MKNLFLICNAHLDPVWQWEWEEGAAAAVTTFSAAADFLEEYDGFVFNHNESLLYEWVEKYSPPLFMRIKKLVKCGKWHITGGWYVQPDCNMPSGESIARQILAGQTFFREKFGVAPKIAVNFDSFGHSKGIVQILQNAGYEGYICCRPAEDIFDRAFLWKGFNGSEVLLYRAVGGYNTLMGKAAERIRDQLKYFEKLDNHIILWGVGNHGGGPSRKDLDDIENLKKEYPAVNIKHSALSGFFETIRENRQNLKTVNSDLNYTMQGCYSSQIRIKQLHQKLEHELLLTEKMCAHAARYGMEYPFEKLNEAEKNLLLCEFHDILPGSSIKEAEDSALEILGGALAALNELKFEAFMKLLAGEERAAEGEFPIFVYNPHPYPVKRLVECEMMLADQNWSDGFLYAPQIFFNGAEIPCQLEKESSNLNLDWRKKVVFNAELKPMSANRFSCFMKERRIADYNKEKKSGLVIRGKDMTVKIGRNSGLLESIKLNGRERLANPAPSVTAVKGSADPWGFSFDNYKEVAGRFKLMTKKQVKEFLHDENSDDSPVRIIDCGAVRVIAQAYFVYGDSTLVMTYKIPYEGAAIDIAADVFNNAKDTIYKINFNPDFGGKLLAKTCFGMNELQCDGNEKVAQDYALFGEKDAMCVYSFGNYGLSAKDNVISYTLMHSPGYTVHPIANRPLLFSKGYTPRIEQGERNFRFVLEFGGYSALRNSAEYKNIVYKQSYKAINVFPVKTEGKTKPVIVLDNKNIIVSALKKNKSATVLRLYNNCDTEQTAQVSGELCNFKATLKPMEFLTYKIQNGKVEKTNILEE